MEQRQANLIIGTSGGTAGKNSKTYKVTLPSSWIRQLDLTEENRLLELTFDGERIIIQRQKPCTENHKILRLAYYDGEHLCSVIRADYTSETVHAENFCENPVKTAFGHNRKPAWEQYHEFLASRCIPAERSGLREYLEAIGVEEYDPLAIIRITKGKMAEDEQWLDIEEDIV